jgi:hypothetical protein
VNLRPAKRKRLLVEKGTDMRRGKSKKENNVKRGTNSKGRRESVFISQEISVTHSTYKETGGHDWEFS